MRFKKIRCIMSAAALLLALALPPAAFGQSDGFFNNADGVRSGNDGSWNGMAGGNDGGSWNDINGGGDGASWNGMEDATPLGGGLLVLALSGVCYAGAKVKRLESKD